MRLPTTHVVWFSDARILQLHKALSSICRWYVVVLTGDVQNAAVAARLVKTASALKAIADELTSVGPAIGQARKFGLCFWRVTGGFRRQMLQASSGRHLAPGA